MNCKTLFQGDSSANQLITIFEKCGTPSEETWPGVTNFRGVSCNLPNFPKTLWEDICPALDDTGIDLLSKMLQLNPSDRISCKQALAHPYFENVPPSLLQRTSSTNSPE